MSYNKQLKKRILQWQSEASKAETPEDLHRVSGSMALFGSPIKFNLGKLYFFASLFASVAIGLTVIVFNSRPHPQWIRSLGNEIGWESGFAGLTLASLLGIIALVLFIIASRKNGLITRLCNTLMHKASLVQYGLHEIDDSVVDPAIGQFGELQRGNHERYMNDCYEGQYTGNEHQFAYQAYRLHYVDQETTTEYNHTEKRTETKTEYHHYDRSGIILDFPYAKGIHLCESFEETFYHSSYKPSSIEFDRRFHCRGNDEMGLARFLKPGTVLALSEAARNIPGLTVEITMDRRMCLGCGDYHVVESIQKLTKETNPRFSPEGFDRFIRANVSMPKLDKLTELAHTLLRYSDSNFSRQTA
jgi:hypothetical protein